MHPIVFYAKHDPMKKVISIALLLAWTAPVFSAYCQRSVNSLVRPDPWTRLGRYKHGDRILDFNIRPLGVHEVSQKDQKVMRTLEENGGRGRYVKLEFAFGRPRVLRGIQMFSPPNEGLYGSAFEEIFKELDEAGIPVFIYSGRDLGLAGGAVFVQKYGSTNSKALFILKPKTTNIINRHELQHLRDDITQTETFKQTLPEVSESVMRLLERKEAKEILEKEEERMFRAAVDLAHVMGEIKASENSVKNLFTVQGLRELVLTRTWPRELRFYLEEFFNISLRNAQLLLLMNQGLPGEMFPYGPVIPAAKVVIFGGPIIVGPIIVGAVISGLVIDLLLSKIFLEN